MTHYSGVLSVQNFIVTKPKECKTPNRPKSTHQKDGVLSEVNIYIDVSGPLHRPGPYRFRWRIGSLGGK